MKKMNLQNLGWTSFFEDQLSSENLHGLEPGRIQFYSGNLCRILTADGERDGVLIGKMRNESTPVTGDWVLFRPADQGPVPVEKLLQRKTFLSRNSAGKAVHEQGIAANCDFTFLMMGLDLDFNPRRLERFVTGIWNSGSVPVILLNKLDSCSNWAEKTRHMEQFASGAETLVISALRGDNIEELERFLKPGRSAALIGSSGCGKSTLIGKLTDQKPVTKEIRAEDGKGKHTTTARTLYQTIFGGMLIDTPGMREFSLFLSESSGSSNPADSFFQDISELASQCRFRDCAHESEPDCAVREALETGKLSPGRFRNYQKLTREIRHQEIRQSESAQREEKNRWKKISEFQKQYEKSGGKI